MGLWDRAGKTAANVIPGAFEHMVGGFQSILGAGVPEEFQHEKVHIPDFYDIPVAGGLDTGRGWAEHGIDLAGGIAEALPSIIAPHAIVGRGLQVAGMAPKAASLIGAFSGGGFLGGETSGSAALVEGGINTLQHKADFLPRTARAALALGSGVASGLWDYTQTGDLKHAAIIAGVNMIAPFAGGQIKMPPVTGALLRSPGDSRIGNVTPMGDKMGEAIPPPPPSMTREDVYNTRFAPQWENPVLGGIPPIPPPIDPLQNLRLAQPAPPPSIGLTSVEAGGLTPSPEMLGQQTGRTALPAMRAFEEPSAVSMGDVDTLAMRLEVQKRQADAGLATLQNAPVEVVLPGGASGGTFGRGGNVIEIPGAPIAKPNARIIGAPPKVEGTALRWKNNVVEGGEGFNPHESIYQTDEFKEKSYGWGDDYDGVPEHGFIVIENGKRVFKTREEATTIGIESGQLPKDHIPARTGTSSQQFVAHAEKLAEEARKVRAAVAANIPVPVETVPPAKAKSLNPPEPLAPLPEVKQNKQVSTQAWPVKVKGGKKISNDDFDAVDQFTKNNKLRVVPEGKEGVVVFETDNPAGPKLRFEVPAGTSMANANRLYNQAKKASQDATLQKKNGTPLPVKNEISIKSGVPKSKKNLIDIVQAQGIKVTDEGHAIHLDAPDGFVWNANGETGLSIQYATNRQSWLGKAIKEEWDAISMGLARETDPKRIAEIRHGLGDDNWGKTSGTDWSKVKSIPLRDSEVEGIAGTVAEDVVGRTTPRPPSAVEDALKKAEARMADDNLEREPTAAELKEIEDEMRPPEGPSGESGKIDLALVSRLAQATATALGGAAGGLIGDTPEERMKNAILGALGTLGMSQIAIKAFLRTPGVAKKLAEKVATLQKAGLATARDPSLSLQNPRTAQTMKLRNWSEEGAINREVKRILNPKKAVEEAYQKIVKDTGFPDIPIAELQRKTGIPMDKLKEHLRAEHKAGRATFASLDWSLSDEATRAGAMKPDADYGDRQTAVRFYPDEPKSTSVLKSIWIDRSGNIKGSPNQHDHISVAEEVLGKIDSIGPDAQMAAQGWGRVTREGKKLYVEEDLTPSQLKGIKNLAEDNALEVLQVDYSKPTAPGKVLYDFTKMKLGGSMEAGAALNETTRALTMTALGAAGGYVYDDENRVRGLVIGGMVGGALSIYGPKILDWLAETKTAAKVSRGKEFEELARASGQGQGNVVENFMRFMEKNFTMDARVVRALSKAGGEAVLAAKEMQRAIDGMRKMRSSMSPVHMAAVESYFRGGSIATLQAAVPSPEYIGLAILARETATKLQRVVAAGMADSKLKTRVEQSFDSYLTKAYKLFNDPKYEPTAAQIDAVIDEFSAAHPEWGRDISAMHVRDYLHRNSVNRKLHGGKSYNTSSSSNVIDEVLRRKEDLRNRPAFRAMLGEYDDPIEMMAATAQKLIPASRAARFFDTMASSKTDKDLKFAYDYDEYRTTVETTRARALADPTNATLQIQLAELEGYVPAGFNDRFGTLSGKIVHRRVQDQLPTFDTPWGLDEQGIIKSIADFNTIVKTGRTVLNPITIVRNILTVPFFSAISRAGGPQAWAAAHKLIKAGGSEYREMMENGILSAHFGQGETYKDLGMVLKGSVDATIAQKIAGGVLSKAIDFYGLPDQLVRASSYLKAKQRGLDAGMTPRDAIDSAVDHVNRYTMNYDTISPGVRTLRQLPFVNIFLSYTSEIARLTKNLAMDAVGKGNKDNQLRALALLVGIPALFEGAQYLSESNLSEKDRKDWERAKALMPAHSRNRYRIVTGREKDGSFRSYDISPLFVADDFGKTFRAAFSGDTEAIAAANPLVGWENTPLLNVISEQVSGKELYTGREISGVGQRLNAARKNILPPLFGGYELENVAKAFMENEAGGMGITDSRTGRKTNVGDLLFAYATGARPSNTQLSYLERSALGQAKREILNQRMYLREVLRSDANVDRKKWAKDRFQTAMKEILLNVKEKGLTGEARE